MLRLLSEVPVGVQALQAVGTVTASDYQQVFAPLIERARTNGRRLRLLYEFGPEFQRITPAALWADTRLGLGYLRLLDGCAVVSDIDWIRHPTLGGAVIDLCRAVEWPGCRCYWARTPCRGGDDRQCRRPADTLTRRKLVT